ncbi:MAG TPA: L-threonylcarbamoyladenylate synthase [Oligoflexia bacterium]|nr:L-threonylcarbamoyladenylate synthase [Oligoflexia bacterium]HMP27919.1 L-threonylcarbamoyladenylate synthase [Oligoflexia bacterium]
MNLIYPATTDNIRLAAGILKSGNLVAMPTETVYGLAANALDQKAVAKIFESKGRPQSNPLIVHLLNLDHVDRVSLVKSGDLALNRARKLRSFFPGPLTIVLPANSNLPKNVTAGLDTVAIRFPAHPVARSLLEVSGLPLAAPSANRSGYLSPTTAEHVAGESLLHIKMILDGGACKFGVESTVLDLTTTKPQILRAGVVTLEDLILALGEEIVLLNDDLQNAAAPRSPGARFTHYAPHARVIFYRDLTEEIVSQYSKIGRIFFEKPLPAEGKKYNYVVDLSGQGGLEYVARELYGALRQADLFGCDLIVVDNCPESGVGLAIMDRLKRAIKR